MVFSSKVCGFHHHISRVSSKHYSSILTYHTSFLKKTYHLFFIGKEVCRVNICPLLRSPWKSVTNLENGILPKSLLYCNCHKTIFSVDHSIPYLLYIWSWKRGKIGRIPLFLDFFPVQGLLTMVGEMFLHHEGYWSDPTMSFLIIFFLFHKSFTKNDWNIWCTIKLHTILQQWFPQVSHSLHAKLLQIF